MLARVIARRHCGSFVELQEGIVFAGQDFFAHEGEYDLDR